LKFCELSTHCVFFNDKMDIQRSTAALMKARYCKDSSHECARYQVHLALGRPAIPDDLAPNDRLRAHTLLRASRMMGRPAEGPTAP
jgi:hypothetical protein